VLISLIIHLTQSQAER